MFEPFAVVTGTAGGCLNARTVFVGRAADLVRESDRGSVGFCHCLSKQGFI